MAPANLITLYPVQVRHAQSTQASWRHNKCLCDEDKDEDVSYERPIATNELNEQMSYQYLIVLVFTGDASRAAHMIITGTCARSTIC